MRKIRLLRRFVFFISYTLFTVVRIRVTAHFTNRKKAMALRIRRRWANRLTKGVGVHMEAFGIPPDFPCILIANHRSYLDPILMLCHVEAIPVSKAEVAHWPILGKGARLAGIIYLQREEEGSRVSTLKAITGAVRQGNPVLLFPEGTTSDLPGALEFKKGSFQIAARLGIPIVPCALHFPDKADYWIGTESFLSHAARRFQQPAIYVKLEYGPALNSSDPEILLTESRRWIIETLARFSADSTRQSANR